MPADPFADALESYWTTGRGSYRYTRDDGVSAVEDAWWYFTSYRDFLPTEKQALKWARGRILDVGCGAGRHSLYLQRKGFKVTALDASPRVAAIAQARGVHDVRVAAACGHLPFARGEFDTVLLFGNNFGVCGNRAATERMLRELSRITRPLGRVLLTTRAPGTFKPTHLNYWNRQLTHKKEFGIVRFRLDFHGRHQKWVSLYLMSPSELVQFARKTGWVVKQVMGDGNTEDGYAAVLEKE